MVESYLDILQYATLEIWDPNECFVTLHDSLAETDNMGET